MSNVRNIDNMAFSLVGYENIIFNIKPLQYVVDAESFDKVVVKLTVTLVNGHLLLLCDFMGVLDKLATLLESYKLQRIVVRDVPGDDAIRYSVDHRRTLNEPLSLHSRINEQGVIDLDSLTIKVPYVYRYQNGKFEVDPNLIVNYLRDFLDHASCIVNRG